jgi:hypothetical protein
LGFKFWIIGIYRHFQQFFRYIVTIKLIGFDLICFILVNVMHFQQYFMATSFSGGRSWSTRIKPPTMGKQLVNFITLYW